MALIAATTTSAAAVATVAATDGCSLAEEGRGLQGWGCTCVGCRQMVVARKSQKPFGDFTQQRGAMFLTLS
jgi:hypothetical protein